MPMDIKRAEEDGVISQSKHTKSSPLKYLCFWLLRQEKIPAKMGGTTKIIRPMSNGIFLSQKGRL